MKNNQISEKFRVQLNQSEIFYLQKAFEDTQVQEIIARKKVPFFIDIAFVGSLIITNVFLVASVIILHQFHIDIQEEIWNNMMVVCSISILILFLVMIFSPKKETNEEITSVFQKVL